MRPGRPPARRHEEIRACLQRRRKWVETTEVHRLLGSNVRGNDVRAARDDVRLQAWIETRTGEPPAAGDPRNGGQYSPIEPPQAVPVIRNFEAKFDTVLLRNHTFCSTLPILVILLQ